MRATNNVLNGSPLAFGLIGSLCFCFKRREKLTFEEGEELLTLRNGKKAAAKITIGIGGSIDSSRKLYLTNQKVLIKGYGGAIELPYSEIKSASKDTRMGIETLLKLKTLNNKEYKLAFGVVRSKRNNFLNSNRNKIYISIYSKTYSHTE